MNIGIIIGRIGGIDGVALETDKWIRVLRRMGHQVCILSGQFENRPMDPETESLAPELSFHSPESYWSQKKAFILPDTNPDELIDHINLYSKIIYKKILDWIGSKKIDLLISENASALPIHLELGIAIKKVLERTGLPAITHDHDFAWERGELYFSPHPQINSIVEENFPLRLPNSVHAVINTNAKNVLKNRYGRDATVIPNVMDFDQPFGQITEKNKTLHRYLGYDPIQDILLFQVTPIVKRKSIDVAIRLLHDLRDKKIKLIITGSAEDEEGNAYYSRLIDLIHELKLGERVRFASHLFHSKGLENNDGETRFSLSDAYANATACTYFSSYEGFGNAFIEAVLARRPVFVNNYKPVFWTDIGSKGFETVMLENNQLTSDKIRAMKEIIYNRELARDIAEHNFDIGKKYFSFDTLHEKLTILIGEVTGKK